MRYIVYGYLALLAVHYSLNPLVPAPNRFEWQSRSPQSLFDSKRFEATESSAIHFDHLGLIVQANGDGGDTAQRIGMYYYVHFDPEGFTRSLDLLEVKPGIFVRHPQQPGFISDPRRFSRDQQRPLIIAMGKYGMRDRLWRMAKGHLLRMGKYQNLDFIGPVGVGEYIRAFDMKPLYPFLLLTDASLVLGSFALILDARDNPDEADDNNHVMSLLQAQEVMPTSLGWLALKIYQQHRPKNFGNSKLGIKNPVHGALAWYHRSESGGNPYLADALYQALSKH